MVMEEPTDIRIKSLRLLPPLQEKKKRLQSLPSTV